jgi:hypothetical protein
MRTLALLLVAACATAAPGAAPARATGPDPADPQGRKCGFASEVDLAAPPGRQIGAVYAGPLVVVTDAPTVTLTCTIVVNGVPAATVSGTAPGGPAGVVTAAGPVSYAASAADDVDICTSVTDGARTRYWHPGYHPWEGSWSTTPGPCWVPLPPDGPNWPECPALLAVDRYAGTTLAETWQDCEGYEPLL